MVISIKTLQITSHLLKMKTQTFKIGLQGPIKTFQAFSCLTLPHTILSLQLHSALTYQPYRLLSELTNKVPLELLLFPQIAERLASFNSIQITFSGIPFLITYCKMTSLSTHFFSLFFHYSLQNFYLLKYNNRPQKAGNCMLCSSLVFPVPKTVLKKYLLNNN